MTDFKIKRTLHLPFLGRGILGSGWQRQTCSEISPESFNEALLSTLESTGFSRSVSLTSLSKEATRFLLALGEDGAGDGGWSGLGVQEARSSWILLLMCSARVSFLSTGTCKEALSPAFMFDLTYRLG
jgi:hypothetical protein